MTADIIRFPRRTGDGPACKGVTLEAHREAIHNIMADLSYPSKKLLLTGVLLDVLSEVNRMDTFWMDREAKAFARGMYREITGR